MSEYKTFYIFFFIQYTITGIFKYLTHLLEKFLQIERTQQNQTLS